MAWHNVTIDQICSVPYQLTLASEINRYNQFKKIFCIIDVHKQQMYFEVAWGTRRHKKAMIHPTLTEAVEAYNAIQE